MIQQQSFPFCLAFLSLYEMNMAFIEHFRVRIVLWSVSPHTITACLADELCSLSSFKLELRSTVSEDSVCLLKFETTVEDR